MRTATQPSAHPSATRALPDARLEEEVARALEADARLEERFERVGLAVERVDDVRAGLDERRLEHVREQRQDGVQRPEVLRARGEVAVLDAREELGEDRQVEDERRREQRVLRGRKEERSVRGKREDGGRRDAPRTR